MLACQLESSTLVCAGRGQDLESVAAARYRGINESCPGITAKHYIRGTHVHMGVDGPDEGVAALNALRTWLPLITALGANSPFWHGPTRDSVPGAPSRTGAGRWRASRRASPTPITAGAWTSCWPPTLSWTAGTFPEGSRLSARYPTVEIHVADVHAGLARLMD